MQMQPTTKSIVGGIDLQALCGWRARVRRVAEMLAAVLVAFSLLGGASIDSATQMRYSIDGKVTDWNWDLVAWEIDAIGQKLGTRFQPPITPATPAAQTTLVETYLARAQKISELEAEVARTFAQAGDGVPPSSTVEQEIDALRKAQHVDRPVVEAILATQVSAALHAEGLAWLGAVFPPVWFTFSEPPLKLVVSPRGQIATAHYAMLQPGVATTTRDAVEDAIRAEDNLSAYITAIGGLGAYPTLVIDRAPLEWVLATIAHEWVHNYLTLFPLGINYSTSSDLTIINETVADIVGDEIGRVVLAQHYPVYAEELAARTAAATHGDAPPPAFDFRKEMRHTREIVDQFLALGRVEDAEAYMEIRRLLFVENGYALRKLNQAYFAFHGSYGTGAAATSPLGPKLEDLRRLTPDVRSFLETVRNFTSPADLDRALATWQD